MVSPEHNKYLVSNYAAPAIEVVRGKGTKVWDSDGKEYLDFTTGIAVSNLGHSHPHWVQAVSSQASELVHCSNLFSIPEQVRLAKRLVEKIGPGKVLFCNSGAEANEGLIKLARKVGKIQVAVAIDQLRGCHVGIVLACLPVSRRPGPLPGWRQDRGRYR